MFPELTPEEENDFVEMFLDEYVIGQPVFANTADKRGVVALFLRIVIGENRFYCDETDITKVIWVFIAACKKYVAEGRKLKIPDRVLKLRLKNLIVKKDKDFAVVVLGEKILLIEDLKSSDVVKAPAAFKKLGNEKTSTELARILYSALDKIEEPKDLKISEDWKKCSKDLLESFKSKEIEIAQDWIKEIEELGKQYPDHSKKIQAVVDTARSLVEKYSSPEAGKDLAAEGKLFKKFRAAVDDVQLINVGKLSWVNIFNIFIFLPSFLNFIITKRASFMFRKELLGEKMPKKPKIFKWGPVKEEPVAGRSHKS